MKVICIRQHNLIVAWRAFHKVQNKAFNIIVFVIEFNVLINYSRT